MSIWRWYSDMDMIGVFGLDEVDADDVGID